MDDLVVRIADHLLECRGRVESVHHLPEMLKRSIERQAMALLLSLRDPTAPMIDAGRAALAKEPIAIRCWTAMIDAALAHPEPERNEQVAEPFRDIINRFSQ